MKRTRDVSHSAIVNLANNSVEVLVAGHPITRRRATSGIGVDVLDHCHDRPLRFFELAPERTKSDMLDIVIRRYLQNQAGCKATAADKKE